MNYHTTANRHYRITTAAPLQVAFQQKQLTLLGFMGTAAIDPLVIRRAYKWLAGWWMAHGGEPIEAILAQLPPTLSAEIRSSVLNVAISSGSSIFGTLEPSDVALFAEAMRLEASPVLYTLPFTRR